MGSHSKQGGVSHLESRLQPVDHGRLTPDTRPQIEKFLRLISLILALDGRIYQQKFEDISLGI